ncbi:hypothetical protein [Alkalicoccus urumqiensis]|uniref:hypothetical protein n=1 Tax=Alkalicoccus urumqiensis TaxID=1548213 RepID=UPI0011586289|nr:hypothetical protein [Alkalicoccus urumqiensis]
MTVAIFRTGMAVSGSFMAIHSLCGGLRCGHGDLLHSRCGLISRRGDLPKIQRIPAALIRCAPSAPGSWRAGFARGYVRNVSVTSKTFPESIDRAARQIEKNLF